MLRVSLIEIALFLLPFAVYGLALLVRRAPAAPDRWHPLGVMVLAGFVLMALGLLAFGLLDRPAATGTYHPAELRDGRVVPGYIE
ncbi:DUF6111 family protein [Pseudoxanthobacter sp.]|uniref:DUF6111 family protein n=1 Tax=Pseudoxanthobacter sp. TaxID=1925742 RepID=UPI002FE362F6